MWLASSSRPYSSHYDEHDDDGDDDTASSVDANEDYNDYRLYYYNNGEVTVTVNNREARRRCIKN